MQMNRHVTQRVTDVNQTLKEESDDNDDGEDALKTALRSMMHQPTATTVHAARVYTDHRCRFLFRQFVQFQLLLTPGGVKGVWDSKGHMWTRLLQPHLPSHNLHCISVRNCPHGLKNVCAPMLHVPLWMHQSHPTILPEHRPTGNRCQLQATRLRWTIHCHRLITNRRRLSANRHG